MEVPDPSKTHRFSLYLPSRKRGGEAIEGFHKIVHSTAMLLGEKFGGLTVYPARGYFRHAPGSIQVEEVEVLELYCSMEEWEAEKSAVCGLARSLCTSLTQESIAWSFDGAMTFTES